MGFIEGKEKLIQLTYTFMFSKTDNIWNSLYEFESDLMKFMETKGLKTDTVTFIDGSSGNRTLFIRDASKEMMLKNDKKIEQQNFQPKKPEKSYSTTKKLVDHVNKSYNGSK